MTNFKFGDVLRRSATYFTEERDEDEDSESLRVMVIGPCVEDPPNRSYTTVTAICGTYGEGPTNVFNEWWQLDE